MLRRSWSAVLFAAVLAVSGCAGSGTGQQAAVPAPVSAQDLAKVTLKVGDQKGNAQSLLTGAGLLKDLPYKLEWATFTSGPPLLEAASAGAIDIGGVGNTPPIFAAAANAKVAAVAVAKGDVTSDALLVPGDSPLKDASELRGKTIAVAKGSSAHGSLLSVLSRAKLALTDVKLAFLAPAEAYAAFTQHQVDAWSIWDPYTSQALLEAKARVLVDGNGVANGYTFQVAGRAALADAGKNSAMRDYLIRLVRAQKWADTHRADRAKAWADETGLSVAITTAAVERGGDLPIPLDTAVVESEQQLADAFSEAKVLPGKVKFADFVDTRFDAEIQAVQ